MSDPEISKENRWFVDTLKNISKLPYRWDNDSALEFSQEVIDNAKQLIAEVVAKSCVDIVIIPNTNMTISIAGNLISPVIPVLFKVTTATFSMKFQKDKLDVSVCGTLEQANFDLAKKMLAIL
jgi:hypothetical protein